VRPPPHATHTPPARAHIQQTRQLAGLSSRRTASIKRFTPPPSPNPVPRPRYTRQLLQYLGQFVRSTLEGILSRTDLAAVGKGAGKAPMPPEITNTLLFVDMFCKVAHIPRAAMAEFVPSYVFDAVSVR